MIKLTNHYTKIQRPTLLQSVPMRGNPAFTGLSMKHDLKKDVFFAGISYESGNSIDEKEAERLEFAERDRQIDLVKKQEAGETDRILDKIKLPGLPDDFYSDFNTVNVLIYYFVRDKRIIPTLELKPSFTREDVERASTALWPVIERRFSFNSTIYDIMSKSCNNLRERGSLLRMPLSGHLTPSLTGRSIDLKLGDFGHNKEILWVDSGSAETIEKVLEGIGDIKKFYLFRDVKKIQCPSSKENDSELEKLGFKRLDSITKEHKAIYERPL
jgi:hypothetical protein